MPNKPDPLRDATKKIHSRSAAERLAASKILLRQAFQESDNTRGEVLGDESTIAGLRAALSDENPSTVENAANALGMIFIRYRKDNASFPDLVKLASSRRAKTRYAAAVAIGALDYPERWKVLAPLLDDPAKDVKMAVCRAIIDAGSEKPLKTADREILLPKLQSLSRDPDAQVSGVATNALRTVERAG